MKSHMLDTSSMTGIGVQCPRMVSHVVFVKDLRTKGMFL